MRILLTADPELPVPPKLYGGIERIVALLAKGLLNDGHDVALVAHRESEKAGGWHLYPWRTERSQGGYSALHNTVALKCAAAKFRPHVIHSFSRLFYLAPFLLRRTLPKVMSFQRQPSRRTVSLAATLARGSLLFTGCSESISARGREAGGRWETVHNFVDVEHYQFERHVPDDAPLVFLSRVESIKGAHLAIEAARETGKRLFIAGNHSTADDGEGRYWREMIEPQIDGVRVVYVGAVDDVQKNKLLGVAAALIVPIQWEEPFGIVFAEALACGTPVISCPRGALPEIIQDGCHGFLPSDARGLATAIRSLASIDRAGCRRQAEEKFSASVIVRQYQELYAQAIRRAAQ